MSEESGGIILHLNDTSRGPLLILQLDDDVFEVPLTEQLMIEMRQRLTEMIDHRRRRTIH